MPTIRLPSLDRFASQFVVEADELNHGVAAQERAADLADFVGVQLARGIDFGRDQYADVFQFDVGDAADQDAAFANRRIARHTERLPEGDVDGVAWVW